MKRTRTATSRKTTTTRKTEPNTLGIAVIQPQLTAGAVEANLELCANLVREASVLHSPDVILLPEAMTSPNVFLPAMRSVPQPVDGAPFQMITGLARELGRTVGGGFLSVRGEHARHTYVLAEPDGTTHLHDKDQPSMWENNFYTAGTDLGLTTTAFGNVGMAMGYEWARSRTARRLRGRVDVVLGGSCFWSGPTWPVLKELLTRDHHYNVGMVQEMAGRMARMTGAPCAVAQHVGPMESDTPMLPGIGWSTMFPGESQIVDASGNVLVRLGPDDRNAIGFARVEIGAKEPIQPIPNGFWTQPMAGIVKAIWYYQNAHGRAAYALRHARHGFPWQDQRSRNLPNYIPAPTLEIAAEPSVPAEVEAEAGNEVETEVRAVSTAAGR